MDRHPNLMAVWLKLELCVITILFTKGEIRCYCDGPQCVATGYMCKSQLSACFTRLLDPQNVNSPLLHGCMDTFSNTTEICQSQGSYHHKGHWSLLECCWEDMCNYKGLQEILLHSANSMSDRRANKWTSGNRSQDSRQEVNAKEIWFRAAVIAVCIAGAFILVLLVMLALRMLRSENRRLQRQHEQMISRLHYSFQKPPTEKFLVGSLDHAAIATTARDHENYCMVHNKHLDSYSENLNSFCPWDVHSVHKKPTVV
ncbi:BMP and activin membrane-bound inhibitor homolog [Chiloscyllium plagiosum]|uniref:BMP and activin membrane-bound inhibitor homolog n=1 Tax=Chiloscyllium plagiosum TaxID=36176 RepID=UPI001CB7EB0B|nr:BMP and activin membrane-bound inhibitor homolog [Chiloscyllium plagiosum]